MQPESNTALEQLCKSIQTFGSLTMAAESRDKLYRYNDALMQSLYSILEDSDCDEVAKLEYFNATMEQYTAAMKDLFPKLISAKPPQSEKTAMLKSDPGRYDEIVEVEKFNPYHDSRGRFASANGYASFTIRTKDPSKQHMADMAIAREKERAGAAAAPSGKTDDNPLNNPNKLAGAKLGDPMSHDEANQGNANPNFDQGGGYHTNCQSCVVAYEARLRGYDVQAKRFGTSQEQHALARNPQLAWEDPKTGHMPSSFNGGDSITTAKKCRDWLEGTVEEGQRYTLENVWKGRSNSGHIISCDKDANGKLRFYDPQSGKTYQDDAIDTYLSRCKYTATIWGTSVNVSPRLTRVDNMSFNTDVAEKVMEAAA